MVTEMNQTIPNKKTSGFSVAHFLSQTCITTMLLRSKNISTVWHETQKCSLSVLRCKDADLLFVYEYIILSTRKIKALHALRCVE